MRRERKAEATRWTDRERDKFLDRFDPYEVSDEVAGTFDIIVATEDVPLILVDSNNKKYAAYLDFEASGHLHGEDFVDIDKVKYTIYSLMINDYDPELVARGSWLDSINEQGIVVVAEEDVQDEALLRDLHLVDGRSIEDAMEDITEIAVNEQWGEGNYDMDEINGDVIVDFYTYNYVGEEDLMESSEKPAETKLSERRNVTWGKTYTYEIENSLEEPLKVKNGEDVYDCFYTLECTVEYTGNDMDTWGEFEDWKVLGCELDSVDSDAYIYIDGKDIDKKKSVKDLWNSLVVVDGNKEVAIDDYLKDVADGSVEDHAYDFSLEPDDYYDDYDD